MNIGIPKESRAGETRVAATPDSVKKLVKKGFQITVAKSAGQAAFFSDEAYASAGARLADQDAALAGDAVLKIHKPTPAEILKMKKGAVLASLLEPYAQDGTLQKLAEVGVDALAMEWIPRTSRAQSMDVLSSQAGIAGYRAVIEAAAHYGRFFPMMMTSAGSVKACRFAVLGVGVAGLQAIASARRMGALVEAYDVRPEVREQILSLGAKNIELDVGEEGSGTGGYAKELSEEGKRKQQAALAEKLKAFDVIVTTANIPGRRAPVLITEDVVKNMRAGSVIIDMAAANGGNCPLTVADQVTRVGMVTLVGHTNYPAMVPADSSHFYAHNLVHLLDILWNKQNELNMEDDIVAAALAVHQGVALRDRPM
jgi:NAD(P) transhydrogenase subunit alpha